MKGGIGVMSTSYGSLVFVCSVCHSLSEGKFDGTLPGGRPVWVLVVKAIYWLLFLFSLSVIRIMVIFFFSFNYFVFFKWSNRKGQSYCTLNPVSTSMDIPRTRSRRQTRGGSQPLVARPYPVPSSMSNGRWRCGHSSGRLRAREVSVRARERRGWHSGLGLWL